MTIQKRSLVIGLLLVFAAGFYGAAKRYSPSLVRFVVEQSLLQKVPSGTDTARLRQRFNALLSAAPDKNSRMKSLLRISQYLEKVQQLNFKQINQLLTVNGPERSGISPSSKVLLECAGIAVGEHPALYNLSK